MTPESVLALFGLVCVAMVTAAPLANKDEAIVDLPQVDKAVNREKRADEEIVFENEQNKARSVVKKSWPVFTPQGEVDQGAEVEVHPQQPITEEQMGRIASTQEDSEEQDEAYNDELKSSMNSIVNTVLNEEQDSSEDNTADTEGQGETPENAPEEEQASEEEKETESKETETSENVEDDLKGLKEETDEATDETSEEGDDAEQDLLGVVSMGDDEGDDDGETNGSDQSLDNQQEEDSANFPPGYGPYDSYNNLNVQPSNFFYNNPNFQREFNPDYPQPLLMGPFRRRRSAAMRSLAKAHRNIRIKRDLLDDRLYNLYDTPAAPRYDEEKYAPITDNEAAILYSRLLDYIEEALEEEVLAEESERYANAAEEEEMPFEPEFLPSEEEFEESPSLYEANPSPYDEGYPYGPMDFDTYSQYAKRGRELYYPDQDYKRSFFPYAEEPDTHWGAFVADKRDYEYDQAIQRLQRLAMALSDNAVPYDREIMDFRKK